jgi:hypothetical protein
MLQFNFLDVCSKVLSWHLPNIMFSHSYACTQVSERGWPIC